MVKQDLISLSPVRIFDAASNGGLKAGQMGIITAKKGLGKTSVLVQFGIDSLIQDKKLVHVSFDQHSSNVISWYDSVLSEIGKKKNISNLSDLSNSIMKDRMILNSNQETFNLPKVVNTVKALKDGGITVSAVIIDGADLSQVSKADMKAVSDFIKAEKMTAWFSGTNEAPALKDTVSNELEPFFSIVGHLASDGSAVQLSVLKTDGKPCEETKVKLDSKTLLMSK